MRPEVVGHGDDERPPSGPGRAVGAAVALLLLALVGVSVSRSRDEAREARERPSASPTTPFGVPTGPVPDPTEPPDPFEQFVTVRRPPPGVLRTVLLTDGRPGFLVPAGDDGPAAGDLPTALEAIGGPERARVLLGWCAETRFFQDVDGTVFYDRTGLRVGGGEALVRHSVRVHRGDRSRLDVAGDAHTRDTASTRPRATPCEQPLYYPTLPKRAAAVHETIGGYRVVRGRYVVTSETRAFCRPSAGNCAADGWEVYQLATLPPRELVGSYTYEGDFLVRGDSDGSLVVVQLPDTRLVARERVGVRVRVGFGVAVRRAPDGSYRLELNPVRFFTGDPAEEGEPGPTEPMSPEWEQQFEDDSPDVFTYRLRPDVEVILGLGITGPGRGQATARTLQQFLESSEGPGRPLWLVFDRAGAVLRVVAEP